MLVVLQPAWQGEKKVICVSTLQTGEYLVDVQLQISLQLEIKLNLKKKKERVLVGGKYVFKNLGNYYLMT